MVALTPRIGPNTLHLKVHSSTFFPVIESKSRCPISFARSTFTDFAAVIPVTTLCREVSGLYRFLSSKNSKTVFVSFKSLSILGLKILCVEEYMNLSVWPKRTAFNRLDWISYDFLYVEEDTFRSPIKHK